MNSEKKKRLGALDVFIIAAVLVCAVCLVLRMTAQSEDVTSITDSTPKDFQLVLSVKNVRVTSVQYFNRGDTFYVENWTDRVPLGEIAAVQYGDAQTYYTDLEGNTVLVSNQSTDEQTKRSDITLTFDVEGLWNANGDFLLGAEEKLNVNQQITIVNKYITVYGTILSIKES